ncbi:gluconate 5-dehydrogenase [Rufibacter latericius]|uniref:Gluconate 5-dehydrogenase n=1 Tax=Rufibacter latericius TaxID=2487040 RepID=A0A3M9N1P2_9BACT|nr:gluconate 5-dehydrogenase [Rufibacter latericius]RNI31714.1 gluconate 5-dehydrogenase [Rufibacter latericius]
MLQQFDLTGKIAWITGGTHGLGMAMARALGQAGATIVVNGNSSQEKVDRAVQTYREEGITAYGYLCDVTNQVQVQELVSQIEREVGFIDILVNNAGIIKRIPLAEMKLPDWQEVINVDLTSPFIVTQAVIGGMIERRGGKIINVCSMMSELGRQNVGAYAAAKGGLKMLTKNMATEWAKFGIQVNGIGPGYFATEQTAPLRVDGNAFHEFIVNRTPAGKWGDPDELGGATVFLASRASNFVNGQILYVDGGILATIGKPMGE